MKLYCFYTESHRELFEQVLKPSVEKFNEFELVYTIGEQMTEQYCGQPDWGKQTFQKAQAMFRAVKENEGSTILWSDVDVVFLSKFKTKLLNKIKNFDLVSQDSDDRNLCSGFFAVKCNSKTIEVFERVAKDKSFYVNDPTGLTDQKALNFYSKTLNTSLLDRNIFWSDRYDWEINQWRAFNGEILAPPASAVIAHANSNANLRLKKRLLRHYEQTRKK